MKYIKYTIPFLILAALLLIGIIARKPANSAPAWNTAESADHLYVSWDTMEFDKCVAAWLIVRFIDIQFVTHPGGLKSESPATVFGLRLRVKF
jgi:carbohydrate-selective porin OprB